MNRYPDWLHQAENDLQWAEHSLTGGFFAQTCFIAQQAGEKALKAYCFFKGFDTVRTHSLFQIIKQLQENGVLEQNARELDLYYISARYPDAFPAGAPCEILTQEQAMRALASAQEIHRLIKQRISLAPAFMQPILEKSRPRLSVLDLDREVFIAQLSALLKAKNVGRAYIVGSYARQEAQPWSDVDLLIVFETEMPFVERPRIFDELRDFGVPFDILVYTPAEFAVLEQDPTGFWRTTQQDRLRIV